MPAPRSREAARALYEEGSAQGLEREDDSGVIRLLEPAAQRKRRSRSALATTETLESAIAAPAITGLSKPAAASGSAATL